MRSPNNSSEFKYRLSTREEPSSVQSPRRQSDSTARVGVDGAELTPSRTVGLNCGLFDIVLSQGGTNFSPIKTFHRVVFRKNSEEQICAELNFASVMSYKIFANINVLFNT